VEESDYRALRSRAAEVLFKLKSVNGVGLGSHRANGALTGEVAIVITRRAPAPGDENDVIPAAFEGVPIDTFDVTANVPTGIIAGASSAAGGFPDLTAAAPLRGGVSIAVEGVSGLGTLGCFLRDRDDSSAIYALTNHHVVALDGKISRSRRVVQPAPQHFKPPPDTAWLDDHTIGIVAAGGDDAIRDAALVRLKPGAKWLPSIRMDPPHSSDAEPPPQPVASSYDVTLDDVLPQTYQVWKRGTMSRTSGGVVTCLDFEVRDLSVVGKPGVTRKGNVLVRPNLDTQASAGESLSFATEGDSGSAILNAANQVVGLLHAADEGSTPQTAGLAFATPIATVLRRFKEVDHLDLEVAVPLGGATDPEVVTPPAGKPRMTGADQIAFGDHCYYRPLPGGAPILIAPMLGTANAATMGCVVADPAQPGPAYILTAFTSLSADGTLTPNTDTKVGQPDNTGHCCHCTTSTVGTFFKGGPADQTPQVGLVALADGQTWLSEVIQVGLLSGALPISPGEGAGKKVVKSGGGSGLTGGTIDRVELFGDQQRMIIKPNPNDAKPNQPLYFSQHADRGAVVVDEDNFVVGVLYDELTVAGEQNVYGVAAPIKWVLDQLKASAGVAVDVRAASTIDDVQTVVVRAAPGQAARHAPRPLLQPVPADGVIEGLGLPAAWGAHRQEIQRLIAGNRKVAALWRRRGGPALVQAIARAYHVPVETLPLSIDGIALSLCVERLGDVLGRYGSPALRQDLSQLTRLLPPVAGLPLDEALQMIADAMGDVSSGHRHNRNRDVMYKRSRDLPNPPMP
jgi:hypothetical protein